MSDKNKGKEANYKRRGSRYRARRRAVDLLFEAEQRGVQPTRFQLAHQSLAAFHLDKASVSLY